MDDDAGVLVRIGSALGGDGVGLVAWFAGEDVAVLENDGGIAEDEIDSAIYVAISIELAIGVDIEGVLVAFEAAPVEDGEVGAGAQRHCLAVFWTGSVLKCYVTSDEAISNNSCN